MLGALPSEEGARIVSQIRKLTSNVTYLNFMTIEKSIKLIFILISFYRGVLFFCALALLQNLVTMIAVIVFLFHYSIILPFIQLCERVFTKRELI